MIQANEEIPFDDILIEYGEFGRYQKWIYSLLCLFILITPAQSLIMGFLSDDVDHWCKIAEWDSVDCGHFGFNTSRQCDLGKRDVGIPWNYSDNAQTVKVYSSCIRYNTHGVEFSPDLDLGGYPVMPCDAGWKYGEVEGGGTTLIKDVSRKKIVDEGGGLKQDLIELFRHPKLRCYTINLVWQMTAVSMVYYGISLGTDSLGVNNYVAFAVSGAVEIPAGFFAVFAIEYWSRGPTYMTLQLLCGAVLLASGFLPQGIGKTVLAMVGKFAIAAAFNIIDLRGCEILPTVVRNSGLGFIWACSSFANILVPQFLVFRRWWTPLPEVIFGSVALSAGAISYLLPETKGKKIPETLDDGENIGW
ncbi:organic cation transporter protein-like [Lytechinus variegatus]|uniref:organic cation transporter protein-like n=1 Tax=Lytechinus variegatus TaxID=7654 RepID=UPI001BB2882D|nr:organic cation transporter protein-like [Lytechinus variegatus]